MNARISPTTQRDRAQERDAALEREIEAAWNRVERKSATDRESQDALTEVAILIRRRSGTQVMKLEFERRMRERA